MCGRFTLKTPVFRWIEQLFPLFRDDAGRIANQLGLAAPSLLGPRFNIAPTQSVIVVAQSHQGESLNVMPMRWGLVPHWADSLKVGYSMINARSETLSEKPTFRNALPSHRCVVIADGYYEWKSPGPDAPKSAKKRPFWIYRPDESPMAFAGLWAENHRVDTNGVMRSVAIITTESNQDTCEVHDRMPAILSKPTALQNWLDLDWADTDSLLASLVPSPEGTLSLREVSTQVNAVRDDVPQMIESIEPA